MSNSGNIYVMDETDPHKGVFLFMLWDGDRLVDIIHKALQTGRVQWMDSAHMASIIFEQMLSLGDGNKEIGFGISAVLCKNDHAILVINCQNQTVGVVEENHFRMGKHKAPPLHEIPFAKFIEMEPSIIEGTFMGKCEDNNVPY